MTCLILSENTKRSILSLQTNNLHNLLINPDPLDELRNLYKNDVEQFFITRNELLLRGINFKKQYQSNLFPFVDTTNSPKIIVSSDNENYRKINYNLLNMPDFLKKFNVESDFFFDQIPVKGFIALSKNLSIQYIIDIFKNAGFTVEDTTSEDLPSPNKKIESPSISMVFPKNEFLAFHKFCRDKNYLTVSDLSLEKIKLFINQPQVGEKKVRKVIENYSLYLKSTAPPSQEDSINQNLKFYIANNLKYICEKYHISYIEILDDLYSEEKFVDYSLESDYVKKTISENINEKLKIAKKNYLENLYMTFESQPFTSYLRNMEISVIQKMLIKKKIKMTPLWLNEKDILLEDLPLSIDTIDLFKDLIDLQQKLPLLSEEIAKVKAQIKERDLNCFILRNVEGETLQHIADKTGLTRERVRQIVKKVDYKIIKLTNITDLSILIDIVSIQSISLSKERLMKFFELHSTEDFIIFQSMLKATQKLYFHDQLEIYTSKEVVENINKKIKGLDLMDPILTIEEVKSYFNISDTPENEDSETTTNLTKILSSNGYMKPGEVYFKKSVSLKDKLNYLFKTYISFPLKIDDKGFLRISLLMKKVFGMTLSDNQRALIARIRDAENVILIDPLTFCYFDPSFLNEDFISEVKDYIINSLKIKEFINVKEIYEVNHLLMQKNKIQSKLHLYSLVQYYLNDDFDIGKGNTLNIYRPNSIKHSAEEVLENLLRINGHKMSRIRALEILHWPQYKLDQIMGESSKFISFDNNEFALFSSLNISEKDKVNIIKFFEKEMTHKFAFCYEIYQNMQFDEEMNLILKKYNIHSHSDLIQIIKKLNSSIKGHSNFVYQENSLIDSLEKFLIIEFPTLTSRKEINDFILSKGYSEQTAQGTLRGLIINRNFIDIDRSHIANRKAIYFDTTIQEILEDYLRIQFGQESFLSVINLVGFKNQLPKLNIGPWTKHLVYNLGIELGYQSIKTANDYRYDKLILVKQNSPYSKYDELIHYVLKNKYDGVLHESDVAKFLAHSGLAHNREKLSFDLKISPFFTFDDFGWITLNEE